MEPGACGDQGSRFLRRAAWWSLIVAIALSDLRVNWCADRLAQALARTTAVKTAMPLTPPTLGYGAENAFPLLRFEQPLALASAPGETNRLFVVEKVGQISVIPNLAKPD